jgi:hypothetical protein
VKSTSPRLLPREEDPADRLEACAGPFDDGWQPVTNTTDAQSAKAIADRIGEKGFTSAGTLRR